jgi:hypothetical protein
MNFAFVTVLLLIISLPGVAFRRSYYASRFSLNYISTNLLNELMWSFIPAIFLNAFAILFVEWTTRFKFRLDYIGYLLAGGNDHEVIPQIFSNMHEYLVPIILYIVLLTVFAALLGNVLRWCVRGFALDIFIRALRFPNRWHYLFTGEYLDIERGWKYHDKIDFIIVDVLVLVGNNSVIYSGILEDYYLSNTNNGLDRLIIKYPSKREFTPDGKSTRREIPGNYLVIPYDHIMNINIQYFEVEKDVDKNNEEFIDIAPEKPEKQE